MDIALRRLRSEDLKEVIEIEREAFAPLGIGTPFKRELNNKYSRYLVAYFSNIVDISTPLFPDAPVDGEKPFFIGKIITRLRSFIAGNDPPVFNSQPNIAGYLGVWFQGNEAHITEIAVRERYRGEGIGELLIIGSVRAAIEYGSTVLTLEARASNFVAQRLYEKYGFKTTGIRKGYYADNREDAVIMTTSPIHSEPFQQLFKDLQCKYPERWGAITIDD